MNDDNVINGLFWIFLILMVGIILAIPITGNIAGYEIKMPLIGWVGMSGFIILAVIVYFKHRA